MGGRSKVILWVVLGVLLVGVGGFAVLRVTDSQGGLSGTPDPMASQTPGWAVSSSSPNVPLLDAEHASGLTSMPWKFVGLTPDVQGVDVIYAQGDGSCVMPVGFQVETMGQDVEVWAWSRTDAKQQACPSVLKHARGTVRLDEPIGTRRLLHGPVDSNWAQPHLLDG